MKVIQILPELNAGGVERGTLEVGAHLVATGHESIVISHGGRMVRELEEGGSRHITLPVHRKSLVSLGQVPTLLKIFAHENPDIIHLRSRMPAWLAYLAWKSMSRQTRPRLVTTVHGFYSVNAYSAVMTKGEAVIAVSESVREYILKNYPQTKPQQIRVIHRGVDEAVYPVGFTPSPDWLARWKTDHPELEKRIPLLLPGRLTRWKGQIDFLKMISKLIGLGHPVQGLIVGGPHPKKLAFLDELKELAASLGISDRISFLGHRNDLREIMAVSTIVYSLSLDPEAFGRISLEALALGKPVIGYNHGGVAEQLKEIFPQGLVEVGDVDRVIGLTGEFLHATPCPLSIEGFTLGRMLGSTMDVYQTLLASRHTGAP